METEHCPTAAPRGGAVQIDECKLKELQELCHEMSNANGLVNSYLLFARSREGKEHTQALEAALTLSDKGTIALMKLMWQLGELQLSLAGGAPDTCP